jgi:hypothetical protein
LLHSWFSGAVCMFFRVNEFTRQQENGQITLPEQRGNMNQQNPLFSGF